MDSNNFNGTPGFSGDDEPTLLLDDAAPSQANYNQPSQSNQQAFNYGQPMQSNQQAFNYGQPMQSNQQAFNYGQPMQNNQPAFNYGQPMQTAKPQKGPKVKAPLITTGTIVALVGEILGIIALYLPLFSFMNEERSFKDLFDEDWSIFIAVCIIGIVLTIIKLGIPTILMGAAYLMFFYIEMDQNKNKIEHLDKEIGYTLMILAAIAIIAGGVILFIEKKNRKKMRKMM